MSTNISFTRATKEQSRLRLAFEGPSGSGKTYTALCTATRLWSRVAVIDTEHGSASKYADLFEFDVLCLQDYHPQSYIDAMRAAVRAGYEVIIIDSLSHAWSGKNGALELVDQAAKRSKSGNSYTAWRDVTPLHNALVDAILSCPAHVIATMRVKAEYVIEKDEKGKSAPRKVGMAPVQREGMDYEFDIVGDIDLDHNLVIGKTRCVALDGKVYHKAGEEFAATLSAWLTTGAPATAPATPPTAPATTSDEQRAESFRESLATDPHGVDTPPQAPPPAPPQTQQRRGPELVDWQREKIRTLVKEHSWTKDELSKLGEIELGLYPGESPAREYNKFIRLIADQSVHDRITAIIDEQIERASMQQMDVEIDGLTIDPATGEILTPTEETAA
jgi:hypothetical protein